MRKIYELLAHENLLPDGRHHRAHAQRKRNLSLLAFFSVIAAICYCPKIDLSTLFSLSPIHFVLEIRTVA